MTVSDPKPIDLARCLRGGTLQRLNAEELDVVLGWITRARRPSVVEFETLFGNPDADPTLLRQVFEQLDTVLFSDGDLNEVAASVTSSVAEARRRARYRRLMAAFHPDRCPGLAPWLTPRSQAIHRSYTRFRRGESATLVPIEPARPASAGQRGSMPFRKRNFPKIRFGFGFGLLDPLRGRLRNVRYLEAKILAVLATIFFFPVLVLSLSPRPVPVSDGLRTPASPDPVVVGDSPSLPGEMSDSATLSLRNLGERLSIESIPYDSSVHTSGATGSSPMVLTSPTLRESAIEALSAKAEMERVAARDAIARLVAAREWGAMETSVNETIPQYGWTSENPARLAPQPEAVMPELGSAGPEPALASPIEPVQDQANELMASIRWSSSPSVGDESAQSASTEEGVGRARRPSRVDPRHLARDATQVATDSAPALAWDEAGEAASSIEDAARRAEIREQTALSAALRETAALDAAIRESAALAEAARFAAERQAAVREAAERETAALELAAKRAAERKAAALETAFRETVELEIAMRESEALGRAARRAADRQAEALGPESANPTNTADVVLGAPGQRQRVAAADGGERAESTPAVGEGQEGLPGSRSRQPLANRPATRGAGVAVEPAGPDISVESVADFIDSYQNAFVSGDIAALMEHLGPVPRENENRGRDWFRANYDRLFAGSNVRRIRITVSDLVPLADGGWQLNGHYELRIDYRGRAPLRAHGPVRYRVGHYDGGWRIDSIQY